MNASTHFLKLRDLISMSEESGLLMKTRGLHGFSGEKLIGFLQRTAQQQQRAGVGDYLEVGVFQGLTLLSVCHALEGGTAYGIDNFSQYDQDGSNQRIIEELAKDNNLANYRLIADDFEVALPHLDQHLGCAKIGTYFVDGPHDYRSQLLCLLLARRYLADYSVIVIDDCNYRHVRLGTYDFLRACPDYKLFFEAYTPCHPGNMTQLAEREARAGWWNGVNVLAHDPGNLLDTVYPEVGDERQLCLNEHLIHSAKYGVLAHDAVTFIGSLLSLRLLDAGRRMVHLVRAGRRIGMQHAGAFKSMNTYSHVLPETRYNTALHRLA